MRVRAVALAVVSAAALLTACSGSQSPSADNAGQSTAKWYASGGKDRITTLVTSTGHVLDGIETMNSGGYTQVGLTRLNTWCGALVGDVQKAEAYAPVPDEKIQYSWAAAVGQLGQGAAACKDATSTSGNVPAAVTASAATLKSGLTNLKTVLETVDTSAASPAR